jgi:hypothetical protein
MTELSILRGPNHISSQEFKPRGDLEVNYRESVDFFNSSELSMDIKREGSNQMEIISNKLMQLASIS